MQFVFTAFQCVVGVDSLSVGFSVVPRRIVDLLTVAVDFVVAVTGDFRLSHGTRLDEKPGYDTVKKHVIEKSVDAELQKESRRFGTFVAPQLNLQRPVCRFENHPTRRCGLGGVHAAHHGT